MPALNLLVLRCKDIDKNHAFYRALGLRFVSEKHGDWPLHYSCTMDGLVIELYPTKHETEKTRLGFYVPDLEAALREIGSYRVAGEAMVVRDPDDRNIELRAYPKPI